MKRTVCVFPATSATKPRSHEVRSDSLTPHMNWLTWDEVYAGWRPDDPLRSYWEAWDLAVVDRQS